MRELKRSSKKNATKICFGSKSKQKKSAKKKVFFLIFLSKFEIEEKMEEEKMEEEKKGFFGRGVACFSRSVLLSYRRCSVCNFSLSL